MKSLLYYLLQMIVASGILYGYYHFVLRNKRFHHYNRFYLLAAMVISIAIPFLNIPVYFTHEQTNSSVVLHGLTVFSFSDFNEGTAQILSAPARMNLFTWENILYSFYILIASLILFRIIFSLKKIRTISKNNPVEEIENIHFVNTDEPGTPFSFFRWLFWNRKIELRSEKGEQIFRHELFHIEQKHSQDIIFTELLTVIFWINPFFHLIKKELKAIHEFLADEFAVKENEKWEYAELLLMQAFNTQVNLTNPFFHNQIKRRIAMITSSNKPKYQYLRKILVLPIAAIVVALFAFSYKMKNVDKPNTAEKPIVVVIDAGHGGNDPGAVSTNKKYTESKIDLEIAKTIQRLSGEYNINVVMTREGDQLPLDASDIKQGIRNRLTIADKANPEAFVSIHLNKADNNLNPNEFSGICAYISGRKENDNDKLLAYDILQQLSAVYTTNMQIKEQTDPRIWVLDKSSYPSVIIECGYIDNPKDMDFIINKTNQEKTARAILIALVNFANNNDKKIGSNISGDTTKPNSKNDHQVLTKVEMEASFPGGQEAWKKYLIRNLKVSIPVEHGAPAGTYSVYVQFIVDKEGYLHDIKALTHLGYGMEDEVIRILKNGPKWIPAMQNGKKVKAYRKQPVTFVITEENANPKKTINELTLQDTSKPQPSSLSKPLIIINGIQKPYTDLALLNPKDIEQINVLKDSAAIALFGNKGKNGVIEIALKKKKDITINNDNVADVKSNNKNPVFTKADIPPSFPGGDSAWRKYLVKNLNASTPVDHGAPEGTYKVMAQFIVDTLGYIYDLKTLTHFGYGMEEEVIRLLKLGPPWIPAMQNGRKVNAFVKQPVTFVVSAE